MGIVKEIVAKNNINRKYIIECGDYSIECAYLFLSYRYNYKNIFCISSQVGCPYKCVFCYNRDSEFIRDLTASEMDYQIDILSKNIKNINSDNVEIDFMGIGEPLLNTRNIIKIINSYKNYKNISFGISTIAPKIDWNYFLNYIQNYNVRLQISLHSPLDSRREKMTGIISNFKRLCNIAKKFYLRFPFRKVALNICLIDGLNDSEEELSEIIDNKDLISKYCYIKLSYPNSEFYKLSSNIEYWKNKLIEEGIPFKIFKSSGVNEEIGCGQLITKKIDEHLLLSKNILAKKY